MRCTKARRLINEAIDGTLPGNKSSDFHEHLEICSECKQIFEDFQGIAEQARNLSAPSPSDAVWLKIQAKLQATKKEEAETPQPQKKNWLSAIFYSPSFKYALATVLVVAIIGGGIWFGLKPWKGRGVEGGNGAMKYTLAKLDEAERHYQLAIKALNEAVAAQRGNLDPQAAEVFRENLEIIDSSIQACKQVIQKEPDNLKVRACLLDAYREKVDFLDAVMEMEKSGSQKASKISL
jgi:hypothetical protein